MFTLPVARALVVEPSTLFFESIQHCLATAGYQIIGLASCLQGVRELLELLQIDFCFVGPSIEGTESLAICRALVQRDQTVKVIPLTRYADEVLFQVDAVHASAWAWLPHDVNHIELVLVSIALMHGYPFLPRARHLKNAVSIELTRREQDVLRLIAEGTSDREMADLLKISHHTARTHAKNILSKLQVNSRAEAVRRARRRGLI